jgi:endonuclease/exonuclease/phosphatase family metal-dependent hydrolase
MQDVRLITFNTAAGNPRIATPEEELLRLPFYREALTDGPSAPILALQEVGTRHSRALRRAAAEGACRVLERRRPGLGNALVIPGRYAVREHRSGYYLLPQLRGIARGLRSRRCNWRQYGELRMWVEARLYDRAADRELTVINTHLSTDGSLKVPQLEAAVGRAQAAGSPVILAGDLNVAAGRDAEAAGIIARLGDMGTAPPRGRKIDYVLASGFEPVASRHWTDVLERRMSDHAPEDDTMRYTPDSSTVPSPALVS